MMSPPVPDLRERRSGEAARRFAVGFRIDARLGALVPEFNQPFFLAGLAGYSDHAMRHTARRLGAPFCVTEAILDHHLLTSPKIRAAEHPERAGPGDRPLSGQVIGSEPAEMGRAAAVLAGMGFAVVDVNLACPSKLVKRRERGGNLLSCPARAIEILRAVRAAVPPEVHCSVKLRRSWDDSTEMADAFEEIFEAADAEGFVWATVHSRTVAQRYRGLGSWSCLAALVRRHPDRLIFGSGDIETAEDIFSMLQLCGVQAVAVARGAIANPWIFRQARDLLAGREPTMPPLAEQGEVLREQFEMRARLVGERRASILMRKQSIHLAETHPERDALRSAFIQADGAADWREVVARFFA
jgi:tRNA-dihydrouridine synthase B